MNVLYISNCSILAGGNRSMLDLADSLSDMGVKAFFFFPFYGRSEEKRSLTRELQKRKYRYVFLPYEENMHNEKEKDPLALILKWRQNAGIVKKMTRYVRKWKIDIVHTNSIVLLVGAMLAQKTGIPHIWHIREDAKDAYGLRYDNRAIYRFYLKRASKVICVSEYILEKYRKDLEKAKKTVLYNGIDINQYHICKKEKSDDRFHILMCGTICENKGQLQAVRAIGEMIHQDHYTNVRLIIVGSGKGKYIASIKKVIREEGLEEYIRILPFQNDLSQLRRIADISLVCSRSEAFGRVTVESMLSESIVVGAGTSGTKELIHDGVTGYIYEYDNINDLKQKILLIISKWEEQKKIIQNAKAYALENFNSKLIAKKMFQIYLESMKKNRTHQERWEEKYAKITHIFNL